MHTIDFEGETLTCEDGAVLRDVLLRADHPVHNGPRLVSCHGLGSCGTCAVAVSGDAAESTRRERLRLSIPPHNPDDGLRLSCQVRVTDDLTVTKHDGFWGTDRPDDREG
jgi:ferredoxin